MLLLQIWYVSCFLFCVCVCVCVWLCQKLQLISCFSLFMIFLLQLLWSCGPGKLRKVVQDSLLCRLAAVFLILLCVHGQAVWAPAGFISAFLGLHCRFLLIATLSLQKIWSEARAEQKQFCFELRSVPLSFHSIIDLMNAWFSKIYFSWSGETFLSNLVSIFIFLWTGSVCKCILFADIIYCSLLGLNKLQ